MIDIAATVNEEIVLIYTIYNEFPGDVSFPFLVGVEKSYEENNIATTPTQVVAAAKASADATEFIIPTPPPSLVDY